ncbi:DUF4097 family beta strand repeat-containing protein [Algoriphagus sp. CAU 1675]|uniref:DUF4097 family beta strand repeat-containing protein n=1 Tax=Algoriphagus sp. CAU 1675 TaxID=3032597 RepID=UPI0023DA50E6|nr:DUF4097 family beta strand repeat-containing protein [Algoriphagus sp. CAU 1675]MDF2157206.1 DUF4097 family beta strand repeat-containing protein [Algoriphagus sp. CAU 1675]
MKSNFKFIPALLVLFAFSTLSFGQKVLVDANKTYSGISSIEVEGGWLDVTYTGGSGSEVNVEAYLASNNEKQDIVFVTLGDVLKISYERNSSINTWNDRSEGFIKITGPIEMELEVKNSSGSIYANNVAAEETNLKVSSGRITANRISGNLNIHATSGSLMVDGVDGNVEAGVTSGKTDINDVNGNLNYESTSGSLEANKVFGEVNVSLTSGNAKLYNIGSLGNLKFTSGNIRAENAGLGPNTRFNGTSGNFRIQTNSNLSSFNFELKASSGNLKVGNDSGNKSLIIDQGGSSWVKGSISSGNITIEN